MDKPFLVSKSAFEHFRRYGRYEGRLTRPEYLNLKVKLGTNFLVNSYTTGNQRIHQ
jgi:hypothetical protein